MHQEDRTVLELELDDEAFDALVEVMEALAVHARCSEECVALLAQYRKPLVQRAGAVLALVDRVVTERACDDVGLIDATRSDRARIHLDEANDVGILRFYEVRNALQIGSITEQVPHARERPV